MAINTTGTLGTSSSSITIGTGRVGLRNWIRINSEQSSTAMSLFNKKPTTQVFELEKQISDFGYPQFTGEGAPSYLDSRIALYQGIITPVEYTLMYGITKKAEFTDQYGIFDEYKDAIKDAFADLHSLACMNIFNNAFSSSYLGFDGVSLCNTAHPYQSYPTWSNRGDVNGNDLALSYSGVAKIRAQMRKVKTARQRPMRMRQGVIALVPPDLEYTSLAIERSSTRPDTANRETNVVTSGGYTTQVEEDLTSATAYWLINKNTKQTGLTWTQQMPLDILEKDWDVRTRTKFVSFFESFVAYWNKAHGIHGTTGA